MSPGEVKLWIAGTVLAASVAAGLVIGLVFGNVLEATAVKLWTAGMISRPVMLSFRCNPKLPSTYCVLSCIIMEHTHPAGPEGGAPH
jgi:hypothetical protein